MSHPQTTNPQTSRRRTKPGYWKWVIRFSSFGEKVNQSCPIIETWSWIVEGTFSVSLTTDQSFEMVIVSTREKFSNKVRRPFFKPVRRFILPSSSHRLQRQETTCSFGCRCLITMKSLNDPICFACPALQPSLAAVVSLLREHKVAWAFDLKITAGFWRWLWSWCELKPRKKSRLLKFVWMTNIS